MKMSRLALASCILLYFVAGCGGGGSAGLSDLSNVNGRVVNENDQPVSGARVAILSPAGSRAEVITQTTTDGTGSFHLTNVAGGTYTLEVTASGPNGTTISVQVSITVPAGSDVDVQIRITQAGTSGGTGTGGVGSTATAGTVIGTVFNSQGQPAAGLTITAVNTVTGQSVTTTSGANGTFTFTGLEPGAWNLFADDGTVESAPFFVLVSAGTIVQTDIYMPGAPLPPGTPPGTGGSGSEFIPGNGHAIGHIIGIGHTHHGNGNGNGHDHHDHNGDGVVDEND